MAGFLVTLEELEMPPWEALFRKKYCAYCQRWSCELCENEPTDVRYPEPEGEECPYSSIVGNKIHWWLMQETERTARARELAHQLTVSAIKREFSAMDSDATKMMRDAAETIRRILDDKEWSL